MMNGHKVLLPEAPVRFTALERGMPQFYFWSDMNRT